MHKCVLVIDDSLSIRNAIIRTIKELIPDVEVLGAVDGKEAIHLMTEHLFQVIICDLEMPNMDGNEFAAKIKKNPLLARKNIILYTSNPDAVQEEVRKKSGVHIVNKTNPDSLKKVVDIVNTILTSPQH